MARLARPLAALLPASEPAATPPCCGGSRRCWRWRRRACRRRAPSAAAFSRRPRRAARAGRAAAGLRPAGAGAAHQPGRHQSADTPWHRGRPGQGRAMLRRAHPPPRAGQRRAGAGARQHHRVEKGGGTRRPRRHPDHGIGLRHGHQGLWFHAARGPRFRGKRGADFRAGKGYHRVSRRPRAHAIEPERRRTVAYHSACSLQHGQKITGLPERIAFQEWISW